VYDPVLEAGASQRNQLGSDEKMKVSILHLSDFHLNPIGNAAESKFAWIGKAVQNEEVTLDGVIVVVSAILLAQESRRVFGRRRASDKTSG